MKTMLIGQLARKIGVSTSALRYYERVGLIPQPPRSAGRRIYSPQTLGRVRIILLSRDAGLTIAETRAFLRGYPATVRPSERWQALAQRKMSEIDIQMERMRRMKALLESSFRCDCPSLEHCEKLVADRPCRDVM
jgi:MerR family transcriptional regulator, redox-sensitive transcriptional activator SoxR